MRIFRTRHGFTLLELIVVVALMGVATTLGVQMLNKVTDCWRQTSLRTELDAMADTIFDRMEKDFGDILSADVSGVPLVGITRNLTGHTAYEKETFADDTLLLRIRTSTGPARPQTGATVMYRVERQPKRDIIVQTIGDLAIEIPIGGRIELAPKANVLGLCLEYQTKTGEWIRPTQEEGWFKQNLPRAVRATLVLANAVHPREQVVRCKVFPVYVD